jgi:hypothetical protein
MTTITGGCQCGAVRFRADGLGRASICHCRMCQKAFGSFFGPLVTAKGLVWTRGEPARFESSNVVKRGFCANCGTPLTFEHPEGIDVAIGALDDPELAPPAIEVGRQGKLSYFATLHELPGRPESEVEAHQAYLRRVVSNQHPDHDTDNWPLEGGASAPTRL